jgi:hypothetical protein
MNRQPSISVGSIHRSSGFVHLSHYLHVPRDYRLNKILLTRLSTPTGFGCAVRHNDRCERWGPAAADARIATDLNGWPPSAPHLGWASSSLKSHFPRVVHHHLAANDV